MNCFWNVEFKKKYQIFISSTVSDLEDERREIMQNILEFNCFSAGMEMFLVATRNINQ